MTQMTRCDKHRMLNCALCVSTQLRLTTDTESEMQRLYRDIASMQRELHTEREVPHTVDTSQCPKCKQLASTFVEVSGFARIIPRFRKCFTCEGNPHGMPQGFCSACRDRGSIPATMCRVCEGGKTTVHGRIDPDDCEKCHGRTPLWVWETRVCLPCATEETNGGRAARAGNAVSFTSMGKGGEEHPKSTPRVDKAGKLQPMCAQCQQRYAKADGLCGWCIVDNSRDTNKAHLTKLRNNEAAIERLTAQQNAIEAILQRRLAASQLDETE